jgi:hypothetical protein
VQFSRDMTDCHGSLAAAAGFNVAGNSYGGRLAIERKAIR